MCACVFVRDVCVRRWTLYRGRKPTERCATRGQERCATRGQVQCSILPTPTLDFRCAPTDSWKCLTFGVAQPWEFLDRVAKEIGVGSINTQSAVTKQPADSVGVLNQVFVSVSVSLCL